MVYRDEENAGCSKATDMKELLCEYSDVFPSESPDFATTEGDGS